MTNTTTITKVVSTVDIEDVLKDIYYEVQLSYDSFDMSLIDEAFESEALLRIARVKAAVCALDNDPYWTRVEEIFDKAVAIRSSRRD